MFTLPSFQLAGQPTTEEDLLDEVEFVRLSKEALSHRLSGRPDMAMESLDRARAVRRGVFVRLGKEGLLEGLL